MDMPLADANRVADAIWKYRLIGEFYDKDWENESHEERFSGKFAELKHDRDFMDHHRRMKEHKEHQQSIQDILSKKEDAARLAELRKGPEDWLRTRNSSIHNENQAAVDKAMDMVDSQ